MAGSLIDLSFTGNQLFLNPRAPANVRDAMTEAWQTLVEPRFKGVVGISTSGSSGDSFGRLIILSGEALRSSANAVNERFASDARDTWFKSLPSFHVGGLGILVRAALSGASVYEDRSEKWDVHAFMSQVSGATLVSLVPTQVFDLVSSGLAAPSSVRAVIVGGGRFEESLRLRALDLGWPCLPSYGMTETCSQIATALSTDDPHLTLLAHTEARTAADGRLEVRAGSLLSAQIVFHPTVRVSEGSLASMQTSGGAYAELINPLHDGWFTAEDRGLVSGRVLTIEGRSSDFVKIGGEGVIVARLEEILERLKLSTAFAHDAVVVAAHDERLGAAIVLVTTAPADAAATLVDAFNSGVAPFERIRTVKHVTEIPRSPLGKLLRGAALSLVGLKALPN